METIPLIALICFVIIFVAAVVGVVWLSGYQDKDMVEVIKQEDRLNEFRNNKDA